VSVDPTDIGVKRAVPHRGRPDPLPPVCGASERRGTSRSSRSVPSVLGRV